MEVQPERISSTPTSAVTVQVLNEDRILPLKSLTAKSRDYAVSATAAGVLTKTVLAPLDRLRLLYQLQGLLDLNESSKSSVAKTRSFKYRGLPHAFGTIYKEEGLVGFWRGNLANIIRSALVYATKFGTNDIMKEHLTVKTKKQHSSDLTVPQLMTAGAAAGVVQKLLTYPADLVAVRMAIGINVSSMTQQSQYRSILDCYVRTFKNEGIFGFYKGLLPTLLTGTPYVALQMTLFEIYRRYVCDMHSLCSWRNPLAVV